VGAQEPAGALRFRPLLAVKILFPMPHAPDLSGHALDGRYELHELIGEGAFGRVYRGTDRRLARPVAVKVIKPWWSEDPDWVGSFEREAQLLARVNDPGIVQIFDVGQAAEGMYYVEELVGGGSLAERIRAGVLPPWEACDLAIQLCSALGQAHDHGVVHRDVKPANVLISADGRVKVGDFGVALLAEGSSDGAATVVGTPRYMAPEQAQGQVSTPATDIYSVGVVLYEMLSGHPPFTGTTAVELALKHLHDPPPPLEAGVPTALERIAARAMAKRPEERYVNAGAMGDALMRAARTEGEHRSARPRSARGATRVTAGHNPRRQLWAHRGGPYDGAATTADPGSPLALADGERAHPPRSRRAAPPDTERRLARTQVAPKRGPRRNVNPAARRRTGALLATATTILVGMAVGAVVLAQPSKSKPPPVKVPKLAGESSASARTVLRSLGLRVRLSTVPAPGVSPGTVTRQSPAGTSEAAPGSMVRLFVAEVPTWRAVTSFSGYNGGQSVPFRIRGTRWRIVYSMGYVGTCTFIIFCSGPNAKVAPLGTGASSSQFGLNDGQNQIQEYRTRTGVYQITVSPGDDNARWSMKIEDFY
jgi:serine/threonine protein kinase